MLDAGKASPAGVTSGRKTAFTLTDDLITVAVFPNEIEAQLASGFLKNSGIKGFVAYEAGGKYDVRLGPLLVTALKGVSLKVDPADADRARKILESRKSAPFRSTYDPLRVLIAKIAIAASI